MKVESAWALLSPLGGTSEWCEMREKSLLNCICIAFIYPEMWWFMLCALSVPCESAGDWLESGCYQSKSSISKLISLVFAVTLFDFIVFNSLKVMKRRHFQWKLKELQPKYALLMQTLHSAVSVCVCMLCL